MAGTVRSRGCRLISNKEKFPGLGLERIGELGVLKNIERSWRNSGKSPESGKRFKQGQNPAETIELMVKHGFDSRTWIFGGGARGIFLAMESLSLILNPNYAPGKEGKPRILVKGLIEGRRRKVFTVVISFEEQETYLASIQASCNELLQKTFQRILGSSKSRFKTIILHRWIRN